VQLKPDNPQAWGLAAYAAFALDQFDKASRYWARAVKLDPSYFDERPDQRAAWEEAKRKTKKRG
jgi:hypothetical protein